MTALSSMTRRIGSPWRPAIAKSFGSDAGVILTAPEPNSIVT